MDHNVRDWKVSKACWINYLGGHDLPDRPLGAAMIDLNAKGGWRKWRARLSEVHDTFNLEFLSVRIENHKR